MSLGIRCEYDVTLHKMVEPICGFASLAADRVSGALYVTEVMIQRDGIGNHVEY